MKEPLEFKDKLKILRKQRKLTQHELGSILGISQALVGQYESGKRKPKLETIKRFSQALHVDYRQLCDDTNLIDISNISKLIDMNISQELIKNSNTIPEEKYAYPDFYIPEAGIIVEFIKPNNNYRELLESFHSLNPVGQDRILQYIRELSCIEKYQNK